MGVFQACSLHEIKPCSFLSEMDIFAVTHYLEINIQTFFELKFTFLSLCTNFVKLTFSGVLSVLAVAVSQSIVMVNRGETST